MPRPFTQDLAWVARRIPQEQVRIAPGDRVVVVGAGISGLAAAHAAARNVEAGQAAGDKIQVFQHSGTGPVKVGAVFKNNVDKRDAEKRKPANDFCKWYRQHGGGQWIGDLILDDLWCLPRIFCKNDYLYIRQVRDSVQWCTSNGVYSSCDDKQGCKDHQEFIFNR